MIIRDTIGDVEVRHGIAHHVSIGFLESPPVRSAIALRDERERRARRRAFLAGMFCTIGLIFAVALI